MADDTVFTALAIDIGSMFKTSGRVGGAVDLQSTSKDGRGVVGMVFSSPQLLHPEVKQAYIDSKGGGGALAARYNVDREYLRDVMRDYLTEVGVPFHDVMAFDLENGTTSVIILSKEANGQEGVKALMDEMGKKFYPPIDTYLKQNFTPAEQSVYDEAIVSLNAHGMLGASGNRLDNYKGELKKLFDELAQKGVSSLEDVNAVVGGMTSNLHYSQKDAAKLTEKVSSMGLK